MDFPMSEQNQPPFHPGVVQTSRSAAALTQGLPPAPASSFHHLSLNQPPASCSQTVCYPRDSQQTGPNADISTINVPAGQRGGTPTSYSPFMNGSVQPLYVSPCFSHNLHQPASLYFQPSYTYQCQANASQPTHENQLSCHSKLLEEHAFNGANVGHFLGYPSPGCPAQQQLLSSPSQHQTATTENIKRAGQVGNLSQPQSPTSASRYGLDPELLPSAVKVMLEDRDAWEGKTFISEPLSALPPLLSTPCAVEDKGCASPCFIRSTSYCLPCEGQLALLSRLPLGALVTPLGSQSGGQRTVPQCTDTNLVVGCASCGASMCPAMEWQDCGQRFYCPFCGKLTEVPWSQYQHTKGPNGDRVDKDQRPELSLGSYEILSSAQEGEAAVLLLAVDVSASAQRGGHLEFITQQIHALLSSLNSQDFPANIGVGLMTYDSRIHLYDLSPDLSRPRMFIITDTEELQLPVREGLVVPLEKCSESISSVLHMVPELSDDFSGSGFSGAPVELPVQAGLAVLESLGHFGKLLIFHSADLMETGHANASSGFFSTSKPKSIFQPSERATSLAKQCVSQGCGVHLFVLSPQNVGGAWPGHVPYLTGGGLHIYDHLQGDSDKERFGSDLKRVVEVDSVYRAQLKIFVSKDLRVSACYGLFIPGPSPGCVTMATVDARTTVAVELAHIRALDESRAAVVQAVLTYIHRSGQRRTRVHTLTLRCSCHLQDTFRNYQGQTLLDFYCKKMYCSVLERPLQELREELQTDTTEALALYRKHCSVSCVSAGQLVLPQDLRALPVYINSLRKSEVLLPSLRSSIHQRLQLRCQVLAMEPSGTVGHFYPTLLPLRVSDSARLSPAEPLRCSASSLQPTDLVLLHTPLTLLLWVGHQVPACTLAKLFGSSCFSSLPSGETRLPALENPFSHDIRSLIQKLRHQASVTPQLIRSSFQLLVVKDGATCEETLQRHLVEDKSPNGGASYADFLYHLHVNSVRLLQ